MPLTGEEIRRRLTEFSGTWRSYSGSERAEAQTYLNELFLCFGTNRVDVSRFEDAQHGRFLDLVWDRVCIIEMKRPSEAGKLLLHRPQAFEYWRNSADAERNLPAPRYLVLCAFQKFEIWEPGLFPKAPRATFELSDLPDRLDSLLFLAGREPVFLRSQEKVTRAAVKHVTDLYAELRERRAHVHLAAPELEQLRAACEFDWKSVEPHIFGSLLEGALGQDSQRALGAHYTHSADIMKVIGPSIVAPWRDRIEDASTVAQAQQLQTELLNYVVLDPACGSGNFLYVAYHELRVLESRLRERERELRRQAG